MKLGTLVNNQQALEKLRKATFPGQKAFAMRKTLKGLTEELKTWEEMKTDYIKEHGEKLEGDRYEISPGSPAFVKFFDWANGVLSSDIQDPAEKLTEDDLAGVDLSIQDIEGLEALGLL